MLPQKVLTPDRTITIREVYGHFNVEVESPTMLSTFEVDKVSGKLSKIIHSELPPKKENSFVEIK
jgi:hypothetical protein